MVKKLIKKSNPPKGKFSLDFSEKWTRYYKEALDNLKLKFSNLTKKEINKVFSLKRKDYSINDIAIEFEKTFKKKITRSNINKLLEERSKAAQIAWSRIKHSYEKSDKSGKWIQKKIKKLNKKSR